MECTNHEICSCYVCENRKHTDAQDTRTAQNLARMGKAQSVWAGCCCSGNCPDLSTNHCAGCPNRGGKAEPRCPESPQIEGYHRIDGCLRFGYYGKRGSLPIAPCSEAFCKVLQQRHQRGAGQIWLKHMGGYRLYGPASKGSPAMVLRDPIREDEWSLAACDWDPNVNLGAFCWGLRHIMDNDMLHILGKEVHHWDKGSRIIATLPLI